MTTRFGIVTAEFGNVTDRFGDVIDDERDFAKPEFDIDPFKLDSSVAMAALPTPDAPGAATVQDLFHAMGASRIASGKQRHGIGRSEQAVNGGLSNQP